jgi:hypothetical protein
MFRFIKAIIAVGFFVLASCASQSQPRTPTPVGTTTTTSGNCLGDETVCAADTECCSGECSNNTCVHN